MNRSLSIWFLFQWESLPPLNILIPHPAPAPALGGPAWSGIFVESWTTFKQNYCEEHWLPYKKTASETSPTQHLTILLHPIAMQCIGCGLTGRITHTSRPRPRWHVTSPPFWLVTGWVNLVADETLGMGLETERPSHATTMYFPCWVSDVLSRFYWHSGVSGPLQHTTWYDLHEAGIPTARSTSTPAKFDIIGWKLPGALKYELVWSLSVLVFPASFLLKIRILSIRQYANATASHSTNVFFAPASNSNVLRIGCTHLASSQEVFSFCFRFQSFPSSFFTFVIHVKCCSIVILLRTISSPARQITFCKQHCTSSWHQNSETILSS